MDGAGGGKEDELTASASALGLATAWGRDDGGGGEEAEEGEL